MLRPDECSGEKTAREDACFVGRKQHYFYGGGWGGG